MAAMASPSALLVPPAALPVVTPSVMLVPPEAKKSHALDSDETVVPNGKRPKELIGFEGTPIQGLQLADQTDREHLKQLAAFVYFIKCPDKDYNSKTFDRPDWWRVEDGGRCYNLVIGGWREDIHREELDFVWAWDSNLNDRRNIVRVSAGMRPSNDDPNKRDISIIIQYKKEMQRARDLSTMGVAHRSVARAADAAAADVSEPSSVVSSVTDAVGSVFSFILHGPSDT